MGILVPLVKNNLKAVDNSNVSIIFNVTILKSEIIFVFYFSELIEI